MNLAVTLKAQGHRLRAAHALRYDVMAMTCCPAALETRFHALAERGTCVLPGRMPFASRLRPYAARYRWTLLLLVPIAWAISAVVSPFARSSFALPGSPFVVPFFLPL